MRGSVYKRKTKKGIVYDIVFDLHTDGKRKQKWIRGFKTQKEAEATLAKAIAEVARGTYIDPARMSVKEYLEQWFATHADGLSPTTRRRYESIIRHQLVPYLGGVPLQKLTPLQVQTFLGQLAREGRRDNKKTVPRGLAPASVAYVYRVLHRALEQAVEWEMLSRNPAARVRPPRADRKEPRVLTETEVQHLLDSLKGTCLYMPAFLAVYTGLRLGEVLALRWEDVDLNGLVIHVRRTSVQTKAGEPAYKSPKTAKGRRTVDISPAVVRELKAHRRRQLEWKLRAGSLWQETGLVCTREDGSPINPPSLGSFFRRKAREAGFPISFHDLRHVHASLLLKAGVRLKVVQERLGHSQITVTGDIYTHLLPTMQREAALKLEQLLQPDDAR
ncbi:MAG: tyrosine-type recombinase/integrase [Bacillota bacterium]